MIRFGIFTTSKRDAKLEPIIIKSETIPLKPEHVSNIASTLHKRTYTLKQ